MNLSSNIQISSAGHIWKKKLRENDINWNYYVNSDVRICDAPIMFRDQQTLNNKWQFKSQQKNDN